MGLGNNGGDPSETDIGDFQVVSNIEAPDTWKLFEAWFQQNFFGDRISLLIGLIDLNGQFDVIETASLFLNSSHGIGPDFSQTGANGPSIFPTTTLGTRAKLKPLDFFYVQGGVWDAVAGDPDDHTGTEFDWNKDEGLLVVAELGLVLGEENTQLKDLPYGKYALGAWIYTSQFEDLTLTLPDPTDEEEEIPLMHDGNKGIYALAEQRVFSEKEDDNQGLSVFIRLGWANPDFNDISLYTGGGLVYTGLIPSRNEDQIGVAVAAAHVGNKFKQAVLDEDEILVKDEEVNLELTYRSQILPWLAVQPNFQWVINPGFDPTLKDAWVFGTPLGSHYLVEALLLLSFKKQIC